MRKSVVNMVTGKGDRISFEKQKLRIKIDCAFNLSTAYKNVCPRFSEFLSLSSLKITYSSSSIWPL
jgi:hypothetical protein